MAEINNNQGENAQETVSFDEIEAQIKAETPEEMQKEIARLNSVLQENDEQYLRLAAEFDNFRKRTSKEKEADGLKAVVKTIRGMLSVYDNLERAIKQDTSDAEYKKGVELTFKIMNETFEKLGVTKIDVARGTKFNLGEHEAMMHIEDVHLGESVVSQVFAQGFKLNEFVIRHAVVQVAN